jgi:hypothetical protein
MAWESDAYRRSVGRPAKYVTKLCVGLLFFQILFRFFAPVDEGKGALCRNGKVSFFYWMLQKGFMY